MQDAAQPRYHQSRYRGKRAGATTAKNVEQKHSEDKACGEAQMQPKGQPEDKDESESSGFFANITSGHNTDGDTCKYISQLKDAINIVAETKVDRSRASKWNDK